MSRWQACQTPICSNATWMEAGGMAVLGVSDVFCRNHMLLSLASS